MVPASPEDDRRITYFAATHTRGKREMFGIRAIDRGKHVYVIGKTGMGKSTLLENMAIQDIQNGEGICFIDPHGSTAEKLLDFVPFERINDVVYFAPFDTDNPLGFNVMEDVGYDKRHLVVSGLMGALKRIWVDAWSARMEYILQNTLLALLEYPDSTLLDVNKMLTNKAFRKAVEEKITDPIVKAFWTEEFANFTDTYTREATPAIQNKIGQFTSNPLIRNIVGQSKSSFDLRKLMDEKKIFIVNLSKGRMGETNASLLGSMLTVKIYLAAMSRADEPASVLARLPRCYFYVDEFQSMMNEAFADILSESRKYKLALTLANQYIEQMEEEVRDAVFGNVGTMIVFRVGPMDAEVLEVMFQPTFTPEDLIGLGIGQIYLTLMIDGVTSAPFSAQTIPPIEAPRISYRDDVITHSRAMFGRRRADIEQAIIKKQEDFAQPAKETKPRRGSGNMGTAPYRPATAVSPREQIHAQNGRSGQFAPPAVARSQRDGFARNEPRHVAPPPARHFEVRVEPARQTEDARSALKAAISTARMTPPTSAVSTNAPAPSAARSPADIMREKHAARIAKEKQREVPRAENPHPAPPPPPARPPERHNEHHEAKRPEPQREQRTTAPHRPDRPGEVSRELLERVISSSEE